jgi:hypothetical protein
MTKILIITLLLTNIMGLITLWPEKPKEPPEIMTLLLWGPPEESNTGTIEWIHGKLTQEEALKWRVWQPANFVLKHRFVIEGRPIND